MNRLAVKPAAVACLLSFLSVAATKSHAAVLIDSYLVVPKFDASAAVTGQVAGEPVDELDTSVRQGKLSFTSSNVADLATAPGQSSGTGNSKIAGQFTWSKPDSNHLFVQIDATATAQSAGHCAADCTSLTPLADALGQMAFQLHADEVLPYTLSYEVSDFSALASGPGANVLGTASISLQPATGSSGGAGSFSMDQLGNNGATSFYHSGFLEAGTTYTFFMALQAQALGFLAPNQSDDSFGTLNGRLTFTVGTPVPLPAAAWLMLSGLGGVAAFARRAIRSSSPKA